MILRNSPLFTSKGFIGMFSGLCFLLILLSAGVQPSSGQTALTLPMGVKAGDHFTFKVLHNDTTSISYMLYELLNDPNLHPSDIVNNQFQIEVTGFGTNNTKYCYYDSNGVCQFYDPIIQLKYTSGTITHTNSVIYAGYLGGQLIVTNDWVFIEQNAKISLHFPHSLLANFTQNSTFETQGSNTMILSHVGWYYNRSIADDRFQKNNGYQALGSIKSVYDTKSGVLNYAQSNRSRYYPDGAIGNYSYEVINKSYHTDNVKIPLANPVPFLVLIVLVRKRLSSGIAK